LENEHPTPGLYVVGTPIGHLADVTERAAACLRAADRVLAEDTRVTRRLLERLGAHARLTSCHRFCEAARIEETIADIRRGAVIALVTDSGMPGVSDPGARIVAACRAAGLPVRIVPGPSAVTAAVAWSGFECTGFHFAGFLPRKAGARARRLRELAAESDVIVLFESPHRFLRLLDEIEAAFVGRQVFVAREMTKHFEEGSAGTPSELRRAFAGRTVRGEITIVIGPPPRGARLAAAPDPSDAEDDRQPAEPNVCTGAEETP